MAFLQLSKSSTPPRSFLGPCYSESSIPANTDKMKMTSSSSTVAIAVHAVGQSEKGSFNPVQNPVQSRIQSSPESRIESRFYHFPCVRASRSHNPLLRMRARGKVNRKVMKTTPTLEIRPHWKSWVCTCRVALERAV